MLLVSLVSYLAVNPAAHEFFHQDATHESHTCVVTDFAAGEGLFEAPVVVVRPEPAVVAHFFWAAPRLAPSVPAGLLPPGCGPPARA